MLAGVAAALDDVLTQDELDDRARRRLQSVARDVKRTLADAHRVTSADVTTGSDPTELDELSIYLDHRPPLSDGTRAILRAAGVNTIGDLEVFASDYALAGEDLAAFRTKYNINNFHEAEALGLLAAYRALCRG